MQSGLGQCCNVAHRSTIFGALFKHFQWSCASMFEWTTILGSSESLCGFVVSMTSTASISTGIDFQGAVFPACDEPNVNTSLNVEGLPGPSSLCMSSRRFA
jgi:hypothetical protein